MICDSNNTFQQTVRVEEALQRSGFENVERISNSLGEPLALVARSALDVRRIGLVAGAYGLAHSEDKSAKDRWWEINDVLPFDRMSKQVYPLLDLIDIAVRAARQDEDVAATELWANVNLRGGTAAEVLHSDIDGGSGEPRPSPLSLNGFNIHGMISGRARVRMGLVRTDSDVAYFEDMDLYDKRAHASYETKAQPFSSFEIGPGDVTIFQGNRHKANDLLPVAHQFTSIQKPRSSILFLPDVGPRAEVEARRQHAIGQFAAASSAAGFNYERSFNALYAA